MGFFKRRRAARSPPPRVIEGPSSEEDAAAYWANQAHLERVKAGGQPPPENRRGVLDEIGKRHVIQSTSHCGVGVMLVGVWYAFLRHLDYLGATDFWRDEYVVAAHAWVLSAIVAYVHKRQSGGVGGQI